MINFTIIAEFLLKYSFIFVGAAFFIAVIFALINIVYNPYRKRNKMFQRCKKALAQTNGGKSFSHFTQQLDEVYLRQWRMWIKTDGLKPSAFFEFVPLKKKAKGLFLFIVSAFVTTTYFFLFAYDVTRMDLLIYQGVFLLATAWIFCMKYLMSEVYQRRARRQYGAFIVCVDSYAGNSGILHLQPIKPPAVENAVEQINQLKKSGDIDMSAVSKASAILRSKGLEGERTVEQQRRLNNALNGLLQAYARKEANKNLPY